MEVGRQRGDGRQDVEVSVDSSPALIYMVPWECMLHRKFDDPTDSYRMQCVPSSVAPARKMRDEEEDDGKKGQREKRYRHTQCTTNTTEREGESREGECEDVNDE